MSKPKWCDDRAGDRPMKPNPKTPRSDVIWKRFKSGLSIEFMTAELWCDRSKSWRAFMSYADCRLMIESALRRHMLRQERRK